MIGEPHFTDFRIFSMRRENDTSGVSGTGYVLHGIIFPDGKCCVQWVCPPNPGDMQVRESFDKFLLIHVISHPDNNTIIEFQNGEKWLYK
mgnify:CR=1 FL=1